MNETGQLQSTLMLINVPQHVTGEMVKLHQSSFLFVIMSTKRINWFLEVGTNSSQDRRVEHIVHNE